MDNSEYKNTVEDLIYLSGCAVRGETPDKERIEGLDLGQLYKVADAHNLTAAAAFALEAAGVDHPEFTQAKWKSIRKITILDADRKSIFGRFEKEGIWYMPLKGIILKDIYPRFGMRQMSDNDIFFDKGRMEDVRRIMEDLGFFTESYAKYAHDVYQKKPVSNFEMHRELFMTIQQNELCEYYSNFSTHMIKDEDNNFGYHLSNEDFYLFMISHEYKHYSGCGTGLRSLLDTYVYIRRFGDELDWKYISSELVKLGIGDFEKLNRSIAMKLFDGKELDAEEKVILRYFINSGTYGFLGNAVEHEIVKYGGGKKGKRRYVLKKLFPPMENVKYISPFFYKHKLLYPAFLFYRVGKALTVDAKLTKLKLDRMKKMK